MKTIILIIIILIFLIPLTGKVLIIPEIPEPLIILPVHKTPQEVQEIKPLIIPPVYKIQRPEIKYYNNCIITSGVQAPLIFNTDRNSIQEDLKKGVVHYTNTAMFGEVGNCFLIGHSSKPPENAKGNYDKVFAPIVNLKVNDLITIYYQNIKYEYKVFEIIIVEPTQMEVLNPTSEPTLTLMTCYPLGTSEKRLIVKAIAK